MRRSVHLVMWIYVLLVMRISSVMGMGMPISSMVMPYVMMPTINVMTGMMTIFSIMSDTTMMMRVYCMSMVYMVMGRMMPTRGVMVTIINMVRS